MLRAILDNPRVRSEAGWVIAHKALEFVLMFVGIKLLTQLMPQHVYGEYTTGLTTLMLLANLLVVPVGQTYYRHYYTGRSDGSARSALEQTLRIVAVITIGVAVVSAILTAPLARIFGLESLTILGIGVVFLFNRWRALWIELLDVKRERRIALLQNVGFFVTQIALVAGVLALTPESHRRASTALLMYGLAAAIFGYLGLRGLLRERATAPADRQVDMRAFVLTFGGPLGILLVCQWLQSFADRYVLANQLGWELTGKYVGVYQVCGVPFMFLYSLLNVFMVPIAYQRARDVLDARQLWSADKVLALAMGAYLVLGAAGVAVYGVFGEFLTKLLTNADYVVPRTTVVYLASARYLGCSALLLHAIFKVHQRTLALLIFSIVGGVIVVPICWVCVRAYALQGAALGILITALLYNAAMIFAPGGCLGLLREARAEARALRAEERD